MGKILFTSSSFKQRKVFPSLLQESFQTVLFSILTLERERSVLFTILKFCEDEGREVTNCYLRTLWPKVKTLSILHSVFDKKGFPFI